MILVLQIRQNRFIEIRRESPKLWVLLPAHATDQSNKRLLRKNNDFLG